MEQAAFMAAYEESYSNSSSFSRSRADVERAEIMKQSLYNEQQSSHEKRHRAQLLEVGANVNKAKTKAEQRLYQIC